MTSKIVFAITATTVALMATAEAAKAKAHKATSHSMRNATAKGKTCKGEFMYMKGSKCKDARNA